MATSTSTNRISLFSTDLAADVTALCDGTESVASKTIVLGAADDSGPFVLLRDANSFSGCDLLIPGAVQSLTVDAGVVTLKLAERVKLSSFDGDVSELRFTSASEQNADEFIQCWTRAQLAIQAKGPAGSAAPPSTSLLAHQEIAVSSADAPAHMDSDKSELRKALKKQVVYEPHFVELVDALCELILFLGRDKDTRGGLSRAEFRKFLVADIWQYVSSLLNRTVQSGGGVGGLAAAVVGVAAAGSASPDQHALLSKDANSNGAAGIPRRRTQAEDDQQPQADVAAPTAAPIGASELAEALKVESATTPRHVITTAQIKRAGGTEHGKLGGEQQSGGGRDHYRSTSQPPTPAPTPAAAASDGEAAVSHPHPRVGVMQPLPGQPPLPPSHAHHDQHQHHQQQAPPPRRPAYSTSAQLPPPSGASSVAGGETGGVSGSSSISPRYGYGPLPPPSQLQVGSGGGYSAPSMSPSPVYAYGGPQQQYHYGGDAHSHNGGGGGGRYSYAASSSASHQPQGQGGGRYHPGHAMSTAAAAAAGVHLPSPRIQQLQQAHGGISSRGGRYEDHHHGQYHHNQHSHYYQHHQGGADDRHSPPHRGNTAPLPPARRGGQHDESAAPYGYGNDGGEHQGGAYFGASPRAPAPQVAPAPTTAATPVTASPMDLNQLQNAAEQAAAKPLGLQQVLYAAQAIQSSGSSVTSPAAAQPAAPALQQMQPVAAAAQYSVAAHYQLQQLMSMQQQHQQAASGGVALQQQQPALQLQMAKIPGYPPGHFGYFAVQAQAAGQQQ